jgi:uncharacterized membrane protein (DUF106 family)
MVGGIMMDNKRSEMEKFQNYVFALQKERDKDRFKKL